MLQDILKIREVEMLKKALYIVSFLMSLCLWSISVPTTLAVEPQVERLSGENRFATAVEVSKKGWPSGADTIIIAVGTNFPDALAGAPLAYSLNAPILLTNRGNLPIEIMNEIKRLGAKKAILLGGELVISNEVKVSLEGIGLIVERIYGKDRYDTSVQIASKLASSSNTAIVAYGNNFPDSLSIAAFAAKNGHPIFLTDKNLLPEVTKSALLNYDKTIVVGGDSVVSDSVFSQLPNPTRISGADRYSTGVKVIESLHQDSLSHVMLATGRNYADALTGSVLAAKHNTPILLVETSYIPSEVDRLIDNNRVSQFTIVGGTTVVSSEIERNLKFNVDEMVATAKSLIGTPYKWGGTSPSGFDCSGFLNYVYEKNGVNLPRTTSNIWDFGSNVSNPSIGDIVFFETYTSGPSHAGIYIGDGKFIHASSSKGVIISALSESYYNSRYLGTKRVF